MLTSASKSWEKISLIVQETYYLRCTPERQYINLALLQDVDMINLSTGTSTVTKTPKEILSSRRATGKVRLPPISKEQRTRYIAIHEPIMQSGPERKPSLAQSLQIPPSFMTDHAHSGKGDHRSPRSPSNLSLQFSFDEPGQAETAGHLDETMDRDKDASKSVQKRAKGCANKKSRVRKNTALRPKGYGILKNYEDATSATRERRTSTFRESSSIPGHVNGRIGKITTPRIEQPPKNDLSVNVSNAKAPPAASLCVEASNDTARKSSTYDLREFLSLSLDTEQKVKSTKPSRYRRATPVQSPVKLSPKTKSSADSTYDVFKCSRLPADWSDRHKTAARKNKLKEKRSQKVASGNDVAASQSKIPSVIVADWSLNNDCPGDKKQSMQKTCELPKANFPSEDFPPRSEQHAKLEARRNSSQRGSVYNLREFLLLPEIARRHSIKRVSPQPKDRRRRSHSFEAQSDEALDVKYDLGEFLTFLESGNSGAQVNAGRRRSSASEVENRSLSVYNIFEFLKLSSPKELSTSVEGSSENSRIQSGKRPHIDVTSLVAKSSASKNEDSVSQGSCYNLLEFLTLP